MRLGPHLAGRRKTPRIPAFKNRRRPSCESPAMRGHGVSNGSLCYTLDLEELVERDHPLRAIERMVDEALRGMDGDFRRA